MTLALPHRAGTCFRQTPKRVPAPFPYLIVSIRSLVQP